MPNNAEFLNALFGENAPWVHVTDFAYDPLHIPKDEHLKSWAGNYFSRHRFGHETNQYFTISNFYADEEGRARRRKALYWQTPVIVLDDVKEKLSMDEVSKLPQPSWILETSQGSEQWGYLLDTPCTDRGKVENLLDGLVANGLAPDGRDPGMKGVTRYVRLPDGYNTKASKLVNGKPFKCRMVSWQPFNRVTLEQLAEPFSVDLNASRRESRVDGADDISDHPLVNIPDVIHIKETRGKGRFDITCPWVDEHTGGDDSGAGIFTNGDGTIGFKCHHGACQDRTGSDLLKFIESEYKGFSSTLKTWQSNREFAKVLGAPMLPAATVVAPVLPNFTLPVAAAVPSATPPSAPPAPTLPTVSDNSRAAEGAQAALSQLQREIPGSIEQRNMASGFLKAVDTLPVIDQVHWHQQLKDAMRWNQKEFSMVLSALRAEWYEDSHDSADFFTGLVYVGELDEFYDAKKRIFYRPQAFQNNFSHLDPEARKQALEGKVTKVDKIDYAPKQLPIFTHMGVVYANTWTEIDMPQGVPGDVSNWLNHWDKLGWTQHRDHMLKWMAWTILHPETKINHILLLGGAEGIGKDFLLQPLKNAMADHHTTIDGDVLMDGFNDHLLSCKYLHINEIELTDHREAESVGKKIKPLAAAPPDKLRVNPKGTKAIYIRNIVNATMGTNSTLPFKTHELSRRLYGAWSGLTIRAPDGEMLREWRTYWTDKWKWMTEGGADACIYYLRNCVDLSNFNPSEAPPVTDFIKHIHQSSKPSLVQTIEGLMTGGRALDYSVLTAIDVIRGLTLIEDTTRDGVYVDSRYITPMKVVNTLMTMSQFQCRDVYSATAGISKYWISRHHDMLAQLNDVEFVQHYQAERLNGAGRAFGLGLIQGGKS